MSQVQFEVQEQNQAYAHMGVMYFPWTYFLTDGTEGFYLCNV